MRRSKKTPRPVPVLPFSKIKDVGDRLFYERTLISDGIEKIAGVDEAGIGALAGPVVAAAVLWDFDSEEPIPEVNDSKKLTESLREELYGEIHRKAIAWSVGKASRSEVDRLNVYQASLLAMRRAVEGLTEQPEHLLVDARRIPGLSTPQWAIIKGDALSYTIGAASILAKVSRDRIMRNYHRKYPRYGFDRHKGYATKDHRSAIRKYGVLPIHRTSFTLLK